MKKASAEIVDVTIPGLDDQLNGSSSTRVQIRLMDYLSQFPNAPVKSLGEIIERGLSRRTGDGLQA